MENQKIVVKLPKTFAQESSKRGPIYYDYQNYINVVPCQGTNYACIRKIGRGKYSQVFQGINLNNSMKCVVKMLKPIKFKKINRQIKLLMTLNGQNNTVKLLDIVRQGQIYCLVFQKINNIDYHKFMEIKTPLDCKYYTYQILKGLHYAHSIGIMHRDIKPQNIIIDMEKKQLKIIDWGLGQFYLPKQDYNVRVSSRYFKGPELLVSYTFYHYSLDIWSLGVMMAGMLTGKQPFFKGSDNYDQLQQITKFLGTEQLFVYLSKYNIKLQAALQRILGDHKAKKFTSLITEENKQFLTLDAINLISKMMQYDHDARPTALQCMKHKYFDEVRQKGYPF